MPEGPEIRRVRDRLQAALAGRLARRVRLYLPALETWNGRLDGRRVLEVESRGKALLTHFEGGHSLYSHNQLYGRWELAAPGTLPETRRRLRVAIDTDQCRALLYSASDIQVWPTENLHAHPFLRRLGPDVLHPKTTAQEVVARLEDPQWHNRRLGALLTHQPFLAGLGNYLRCEILHCAGLHPAVRPRELSSEARARLAETVLRLARRSYRTGGVTNDLERAEALRARGLDFEAYRFHVFRRAGQPCYRCGTPILKESAGGQTCYRCPRCQG